MIPFNKYFQIIEEGQSVLDYLKVIQKSQQLKSPEYAYSGPADFILKHGKQYQSDVLDRQCSYKAKQCFYNAQSIGLGGRIGYVEGMANSVGIPMPHAWNTINDKVIDMTWKFNNNDKPVVGVIPADWEYFGVQLPNKMINKMWDTGQSSAMIDDWETGFPLLKKLFKS